MHKAAGVEGGVGILRYLVHQIPFCHRFHVDVAAVAGGGVSEVVAEEGVLGGLHLGLDGFVSGVAFSHLGVVDGKGVGKSGGVEDGLVVAGLAVHFYQQSVVAHVHTACSHAHGLAQQVDALIAAVEREVYSVALGGVVQQTQLSAHIEGYLVAHQRLVVVVGQKHPTGVGCCGGRLTAGKPDRVGLFRKNPTGVAAPLYHDFTGHGG